jgi:GNAT superfamily N-acetyltransferase
MKMDFTIRLFDQRDIDDVLELSLLAWEPVFDSFRHILGTAIFAIAYPDWKAMQKEVVATHCTAQENRLVWVAEVAGKVAGLLVCELKPKEATGEVYLLAVHPGYQNRGIATALHEYALSQMKEHGMKLAMVGTGGDPGHAPARRTYEKAGYVALPSVWYFKEL